LLEFGASHVIVTYSDHLDCMSTAYMFRVICILNKASCRTSKNS